ncbi:Isopropylmalate/citramalate isomerase large subunit [uncultured archaeon]|nr:Isopropylmalate/citramalate isomerase large subunit [uncultured archaeon]
MSKNTLYDKVWSAHTIWILPTGQTQIFVGRHLIHEVTSPQAFEMLRDRNLSASIPELATAVADHVIPTDNHKRPFADSQAEIMTAELEKNVKEFNLRYFALDSGAQGVCHVTFSEAGLIWPGQLVVCGDSHTCTYGAFGDLAFGIGTTQVSHVLATQSMAMEKLKVRRINVTGKLKKAVTTKDVALHIIRTLGVKGGVGFAYEFGGSIVEAMSMEERMTLCNLAVEGGARLGYVNPDKTTFDYLKGKPFAPKKEFERAVNYWRGVASGSDAEYDDIVEINVSALEPIITWGINTEQGIKVSENVPALDSFNGKAKEEALDAFNYMGLSGGQALIGTKVDVVFIGSCTNGRLSDLKLAAEIIKGKKVKVRTMVVSGSEEVKKQAEVLGLDKIFKDAGCEWRLPGCSMCLAMNPDKLVGNQRSASTSNRNFKGRQGSPNGRTHLMSPYTAAATAVEGVFADPRKYL